MTLSRRAFLQAAGASMVGAGALSGAAWGALQRVGRASLAAQPPTMMLRALVPLAVLATPHADAHVVQQAWPDALLPLPAASTPAEDAHTAAHGSTRVVGGYVPTRAVQPVLMRAAYPPATPGTWAQLHAPSAALRAHIGADAPLAARVGWGAVLWCDDWLPDDDGGHLRLAWAAADGTQHAGWGPARAWHSLPGAQAPIHDVVLHLDRTARTLALWHGDALLLAAPFAPQRALRGGPADVVLRAPGATMDAHPGAPTLLDVGGAALVGVTWHNSFDDALPAAASHMPAWAAHALARWQPTRAVVV